MWMRWVWLKELTIQRMLQCMVLTAVVMNDPMHGSDCSGHHGGPPGSTAAVCVCACVRVSVSVSMFISISSIFSSIITTTTTSLIIHYHPPLACPPSHHHAISRYLHRTLHTEPIIATIHAMMIAFGQHAAPNPLLYTAVAINEHLDKW